jgi:pyruvate/2-oxoacid:ferredoxin oxidoreductase alpha subunit
MPKGTRAHNIAKAWYNYDNKISSIVYDTEEFKPNSKVVQELQDKFDELKGRLSRKNTYEQKKRLKIIIIIIIII